MTDITNGNLFGELPENTSADEEFFEQLISGKNVRIERIVSTGQSSPADFWYDQDNDEWVALLSGSAELEFQDGSVKKLQPGDWTNIPAHTKHRIKSTQPDTESVWLAVHYNS